MTRERVLITGGAAGIGAACAERCEADGFEAVVIDRVGSGFIADLSDTEATEKALNQALAGGPITRLVNNVGVVVPAGAGEQSLEELELAWSLNVRCAMQCMQALLPGMQASGFGRIVNMSSRAALGVLGDQGRVDRHDTRMGPGTRPSWHHGERDWPWPYPH
jgi:3-oxoacyl-[acyl-carrier protein] reductase